MKDIHVHALVNHNYDTCNTVATITNTVATVVPINIHQNHSFSRYEHLSLLIVYLPIYLCLS